MQIDWFTFTAQIVNFLVLVWLLKRFLYRPVLDAIDGREQAIADRLAVAEQRETEAEQTRESFEQQQADLSHLKESLLADAQQQADEWRTQRMNEMRAELDAARESWQQSLQREQGQFLDELKQRSIGEVQELTRHVLHELADQRLEEQVIQIFLTRLDEEQSDEQRFTSENDRPAIVRTAFPLTDDDQAALTDEVRRSTGAANVRFEVDPNLICGIELVADDHKLQWSVDGYLDTLQHSIQSALRHETAAPTTSPA